MKKQIIILFLFIPHLSSWSQQSSSTNSPCTDDMIKTAKGRWIKYPDLITGVTAIQQQQAFNRLDATHDILLKLYPQPTGVDIRWKRSIGIGYFGSQREYFVNPDKKRMGKAVNLLPIASFHCFANFPPHYCAHTDKGDVFKPGDKNEDGRGIMIFANDFHGAVGGLGEDDDWTINGFPVKRRSPVLNEKWKGYDVQCPGPGAEIRYVLIHREGILPYKAVTRKQYLDRCISHQTKLYDELIRLQEQMPVRALEEQEKEKKAKLAKFEKDFGNDPKRLKAAVDYYLSGYQTDQQQREERINKVRQTKDKELKSFNDELEKTTREGLLDSPALVLVMYYPGPVFETDPEKGYMLVTDNPDYIRKALPNYIPQFMVLTWRWSDYAPHKEYEKILLQNFPIEKLQAMIDK
jgi:hypothetical protein